MAAQALGTTHSLNVDLTRIENAETRRALRQIVQQTQESIDLQQVEIEALLELMLEKHLAGLSEFKRIVQRIQQHASERHDRMHSALTGPGTGRDGAAAPVPKPASPSMDDEESGRQVYRL